MDATRRCTYSIPTCACTCTCTHPSTSGPGRHSQRRDPEGVPFQDAHAAPPPADDYSRSRAHYLRGALPTPLPYIPSPLPPASRLPPSSLFALPPTAPTPLTPLPQLDAYSAADRLPRCETRSFAPSPRGRGRSLPPVKSKRHSVRTRSQYSPRGHRGGAKGRRMHHTLEPAGA